MPILEITVVGAVPPGSRDGLAARLAESVGEALGARPGGTWVTLHPVDENRYAESAGGPPPGVRPVFVSLLQAETPGRDELARQAESVSRAVARCLGRAPENVHVLFQPSAAGRIAFGGRFPGEEDG